MSSPCPHCGAAVDRGKECARCLMKLVLEGGGSEGDLEGGRPPTRAPSRRKLLWSAALVVSVLSVVAALPFLRPEPPPDPRDGLLGSWRGAWTSERDPKVGGSLETVIVRSESDPKVVRLSLTLGGKEPFIAVGDFQVAEERGRMLLEAKRLSVRGQTLEGRWRFTILRSGRRQEGTYTIAAPGMTDSGTFDQDLVGP